MNIKRNKDGSIDNRSSLAKRLKLAREAKANKKLTLESSAKKTRKPSLKKNLSKVGISKETEVILYMMANERIKTDIRIIISLIVSLVAMTFYIFLNK